MEMEKGKASMENYKKKFSEEGVQFVQAAKAFFSGEMDKQDYKGISGGFGSYAEKGGKSGMLRLRMTAGRLTKERFSFLVDTIRKYQIPLVKLTTCEAVQIHRLPGEIIPQIYQEALEHDIFCRGGGGDFPRNVMASPLSGVQEGEAFDIMPYAEAAAGYLLGLIGKVKLPRKLKVAFSNGAGNETHATFRDLGFIANPDGTFDIYSAGGLGNNPKLGLKVADHIAANHILYYIKAMVDTFVAHGNYTVRSKARTRYMQDTLGKEGYIQAFQENAHRALQAGGMEISPEIHPISKKGSGNISGKRVLPQKQEGLFTVAYHPLGGTPSFETLERLWNTIRDMEAVEGRIAPDETLYIINCTAQEARRVLEATADGAETLFETSVACIGVPVCQQGIGDSQALYHACVKAVRNAEISDGALPQIHISGCPSSCGTHQIGALGFRGGMKQVNGAAQPSFNLYVNGCDIKGEEAFGQDFGAMLAENIPAFLVELGLSVQAEESSFAAWYPAHGEEFRRLAEKYLA